MELEEAAARLERHCGGAATASGGRQWGRTGRQRTGEIERELGRAWASAGHLEHVEVVGDGGGRPERAGDDDPRRRRVVHVGSDLGSIRARVSGRRG